MYDRMQKMLLKKKYERRNKRTIAGGTNIMRTKKQLIACGLSLALLLGMIPANEVSAAKKVKLSTRKLTVTKGKSKTLRVKNARKAVKWKILYGKRRIALKKKSNVAVTIKGRKKGTAKVQATIGRKKLVCKVTVTNKKPSISKPKKTSKPTPKPKKTSKPKPTAAWENVEKYSYEVYPLMAPFNEYFYIKTDNPDPDSFQFADEETKYPQIGIYGEGKFSRILPTDVVFSDVKYENKETRRVKGGYIANVSGADTDGGELRLQERRVVGTTPVKNLNTGEIKYEKEYEYRDTAVTVQVDELKDVVDYLISTFGDSSKPYFDNLSGIQSGFKKECLYSGVYVLGEQKKSTTTPYYGLSTSPHVDQAFYIQSPYYRSDSKSMLVSALYPMRYDSLGFPSIMRSVAEKLDSTVSVKWSSTAHYLIDVTYNGETRSYGGQGSGGGQGINANQIKYWYSFDGSDDDAYMKRKLEDVSSMIREYGELEVPEEPTDQLELTWESVRKTVGKEGSYVKLTLFTSVFGGSTEGYTFMYDDGRTGEGSQGWGAVGHFSNAWYDGRYFNRYEYYYPGAKFEDTVKTESPAIIMKDVDIKLPDDGKTYYYNYQTMDKVSRYNAETGKWSGFMAYQYDSKSQTWRADILDCIKYYGKDYEYKSIDDQNFIDACTITMDEALAMNLDANTDKEPSSYYIYDRVTSPGTYHSAGN